VVRVVRTCPWDIEVRYSLEFFAHEDATLLHRMSLDLVVARAWDRFCELIVVDLAFLLAEAEIRRGRLRKLVPGAVRTWIRLDVFRFPDLRWVHTQARADTVVGTCLLIFQ